MKDIILCGNSRLLNNALEQLNNRGQKNIIGYMTLMPHDDFELPALPEFSFNSVKKMIAEGRATLMIACPSYYSILSMFVASGIDKQNIEVYTLSFSS